MCNNMYVYKIPALTALLDTPESYITLILSEPNLTLEPMKIVVNCKYLVII